jgi:hypothetical protein
MVKEIWVEVNVAASAHLALVLDASESAHLQRPVIRRLGLELLKSLSPYSCSVYFLGDTEPHTRNDLESRGAQLSEKNRNRASVIGPLLENLSEQIDTFCIVLACGRIYDLEDWLDTKIAERLVVANFGSDAITGGICCECEPTLAQIFQTLPFRTFFGLPKQLEISGASVMPFFWDNRDYKWTGQSLMAEKIENWKVHVGLLCTDTADLRALATFSGSSTRNARLTISSPSTVPSIWKSLSLEDAEIFRQVTRDGHYHCPFCDQQHSAEFLRCRNDVRQILGRYIYSFLPAPQNNSFVLFEDIGNDIRFTYHFCESLRIRQDAIALRAAGRTEIYELDSASHSWVKGPENFKQYQLISNNIYAIGI